MKKYIICTFWVITFLPSFSQSFKPGEIWKDLNGRAINAHGGGMLFHDGIYYWYGEFRGDKKAEGVSCYSSKDLYNWKNEGLVLQTSQDTNSLLQYDCIIERPKVIYNQQTNKYVMWFHHELKNKGYSSALTGLAIADNPNGPYKYLKSIRPHKGILPKNFSPVIKNANNIVNLKRSDSDWKKRVISGALVQRDLNGGQMSRDMTLFVDDDGSAYHIASSEDNQTLHISKLTGDYQNFEDEYYRVLPGGTNEAPAIVKYQNKYYLVASGTTGWKPNPARSYVADSIYGEWKALGNPVIGSEVDKATTFHSQSTYILTITGKPGQYVYMGDRWNANDLKDSRYIWLPLTFENEKPILRWQTDWKWE